MPVSALVITLSKNPVLREMAIDWLTEDERFTLGKTHADQLPVVFESEDLRSGADTVRRELPEVTGIDFIHVVSVDFSDLEETTHGEASSPPLPHVRS